MAQRENHHGNEDSIAKKYANLPKQYRYAKIQYQQVSEMELIVKKKRLIAPDAIVASSAKMYRKTQSRAPVPELQKCYW